MAMFITKRIEAYVEFAQFCRRYDLPPHKVGEVAQLVSDYRKAKGWQARDKFRREIDQRLNDLGFRDVAFRKNNNGQDELVFLNNLDDVCYLPNIV